MQQDERLDAKRIAPVAATWPRLVALLLAAATPALAQAPTSGTEPPPCPVVRQPADTTKRAQKPDSPSTCTKDGIEAIEYRTMVNRQFASLVNSSSNNNIGRFATYDFKDGRITFAGSFHNEGHVLTVSANGAGSDNVLPVFGEGEFSSDVGLKVQWHQLKRKQVVLNYATLMWDTYLAERDKAMMKHASEVADLRNRGPQARASLRLAAALRDSAERATRIARRLATLGSTEAARDLPCLPGAPCARDPELDSLRAAEAVAAVERGTLLVVARDTDELAERLRVGNERADALTKAEDALRVRGFSIKWLSLGAGIQNRGFKLFDALRLPESQVQDTSYLSLEATVQYSWFSQSPVSGRTRYVTVGLTGARTDNASTLTKTELTEVTQHGATPDVRRTSKTYSALTGPYRQGVRTLKAFADGYLFVKRDAVAALHLYPSAERGGGANWVPFYGVGVVGVFRDAKATRVTAELFYEVTDSSSRRFTANLEGGTVGLRFALPFSFSTVE